MTRLADRKTRLRVETSAKYQGVPLVFEAAPFALDIWKKAQRFKYTVPYAAIFELGAKLVANEKRLETARIEQARRRTRRKP
jgi:hypothetical protein